MKRITLTMLFAVIAGAPALAQEPPVPPTPPARPAPAVPAPMPAPAPRVYPTPARPPVMIDQWDIDRMRDQALEMSRMDRDAARMNGEIARMNAEAARIPAAAVRIDADAIRDAVREATRNVDRMNIDAVRDYAAYAPMAALAPMAPLPPMPAMPASAPMAVPTPFAYVGDDFHFRTPPAPWQPGDPADSLYRIARNALTNGDYGRAAKLFSDLAKNYSKSVYANDALYFEATARYRIGTTDELQTAANVLEPLVAKIPAGTSVSSTSRVYPTAPGSFGGRSASDGEVLALYTRINGALAQRGNRDAANKIARLASQGGTRCDNEDTQVKIEAMNALSQMDATKSAPGILRGVLDRKDECSASLRRNAVFMLGRRTDAESANLLMGVAKSDPDYSVRTSAIDALSHVQSEAAFSALEDLLRNDQDERIQRSVVSALMRSDNAKARSSMRALIDRKDAPVNLRIEAIQSFNSDRTTAEDGAYLRGLYPKAESDNLKRAIIDAVSRMGGTDNEQWLLALAKNPNESSQIRSQAIGRMMRSNIPVAEVVKLYDAADNYNMRSQLISVFRTRKETEAADKLVDIAKNGTDYKLRSQAVSALASRNDPRSQQLFIDILDGKKP